MSASRIVPFVLAVVFAAPVWAQSSSNEAPDYSALSALSCCDTEVEPGQPGQQLCTQGHTCCESGGWRCNDDLGLSTCDGPGEICRPLCCDPTDEPGELGNPPCFEGATCCADGRWRCNDATGASTCAVDSDSCSSQCCDPLEQPGELGNPPCFEGATCCATGEWQCNDAMAGSTCALDGVTCSACCELDDQPSCIEGSTCCSDGNWQCNEGDGSSTCNIDGIPCEPRCCDTALEPGALGTSPCVNGATCCLDGTWRCNAVLGQSNCPSDGVPCVEQCCDPTDQPQCIEGSSCCSDGQWACNDGAGNSTCPVDGSECETCCDPLHEPGMHGNPICFEGATCCADGLWSCNEGDGSSTCDLDGVACEGCCDPLEEPGQFGNPICIEGATCCSDGGWQCNDGTGGSTCTLDGVACELQCCDPFSEPGAFGNPPCFEGASCCSTGAWQCNDPAGGSTCDVDGAACESCCDPAHEPGAFGNPPCFEGANCCDDGTWQCNEADGSSTCAVDGLSCPGCCDPADEPGQSGTLPCIEGATCCADGTWQCNAGDGSSTCAIDGPVCEPRCCDPDDRPNMPGNPFCFTGFHCCDDGEWRCNAADGSPTCPGEIGDECPQICGGFPGLECDPGEFCNLPIGECCCDAFGVCEDLSNFCPAVYEPVCGCDGVSYNNACEAARAGVSIDSLGPCPRSCGGVAGLPCDENEYCRTPDGECCCDIPGTCYPVPQFCPAECDPVCSCDGVTYTNECEAARAEASIEHYGACENEREVRNVRFGFRDTVSWSGPPDSLGFNVYRKIHTISGAPHDFGNCLYTDLSVPFTTIPGEPMHPRELWLFQVTALFDDGEGPMGIDSNCTPRRPAAPCTCTLPPDPGPCDGTIPRWFHNFRTDACEQFIWGGCGGNANNFETLERCEAACRDSCALPPDSGDCQAAIPRWFFSEITEQCEPFIWGGCGGNENNYVTFEECQDSCVCSLPADVGPCDGVFPRWFHNVESLQCEEFIWGGCLGNANNFETEPGCEAACELDIGSVDPSSVPGADPLRRGESRAERRRLGRDER